MKYVIKEKFRGSPKYDAIIFWDSFWTGRTIRHEEFDTVEEAREYIDFYRQGREITEKGKL